MNTTGIRRCKHIQGIPHESRMKNALQCEFQAVFLRLRSGFSNEHIYSKCVRKTGPVTVYGKRVFHRWTSCQNAGKFAFWLTALLPLFEPQKRDLKIFPEHTSGIRTRRCTLPFLFKNVNLLFLSRLRCLLL
jgi:hypothetical protein